MTDTTKATDKVADAAEDTIEIIQQVIPASVAIGMLIVGMAIGAAVILLWAYAEQQKEAQKPEILTSATQTPNNGFGTSVLD